MTEDSISIFRPATADEKANFVEIGKKNSLDIFLGKLANTQQEYQREYKPFCTHCARVDFEKKIRDVAAEYNSSNPDVGVSGVFKFEEFKKYGDMTRFELVDTKDTREEKLVDRIRNVVIIGKEYTFKCKVRGCGLTVFVPNEDLPKMEALLNKDTKKKE